jgi:hypothetical protein
MRQGYSMVPALLQPGILSYNCAQGEIVMHTAILTFAFVMGMAAVAIAMPLTPSAGSSNVVLVHGCHHYYAQDISGWHRHDKNCARHCKEPKLGKKLSSAD